MAGNFGPALDGITIHQNPSRNEQSLLESLKMLATSKAFILSLR